eukprot:CAMPEP_0116053922 /NCGR_PEP_ID=MMETSP0322-20121206/2480_1 /TAXON_ID=163516 /ORGANISM="Leptocylindrus danicus var. apora, Strain B651" /LENGTH=719 /DNA_ID=CAMNT_0003537187 /DNA_START=211 /DNA_END=2370 /DNA_ORIENTATION=+
MTHLPQHHRQFHKWTLLHTATALLSTTTTATQTLHDGTHNLAQASLNVLKSNLMSIEYELDDNTPDNAWTDLYNEDYRYIIPCSSTYVRTVMDTNEAMLAARAFSKSGNANAAWDILSSVFAAQGSNGFIPRYVYFDALNLTQGELWLNGTAYPNYSLFGVPPVEFRPVDEGVRGSGMLAATPMLSSMVLDVFYLSNQADVDEDMLEMFVDKLYRWHEFLHSDRTSYNIIHPWESLSQLDSPVWVQSLGLAMTAVNEVNYTFTRGEVPEEVTSADDYPGDEIYTAMLFLVDCLMALEHSTDINQECPFGMTDVSIAALLVQADIDLESMADMINDIKSKDVVSNKELTRISDWKTESSGWLEDLWREAEGTQSYLPSTVDETGSISVVVVPIADNFMPVWRGWNRFLKAHYPGGDELYSGEFRDYKGGERFDSLIYQMTESKDSDSPYAFGCQTSNVVRSHGCNLSKDYFNGPPVISPMLNYFLSNGIVLNGDLGVGHYIRNTTLNLVCELTPNSDSVSIDECPLDPVFAKRFNASNGEPRKSSSDLSCSVTNTATAAISYDLLFSDKEFDYDEGIPIASVWVTVLIAAELTIALFIMLTCISMSVNLLRSLKVDDDEMVMRLMRDSNFINRWGFQPEEAGLIYGADVDGDFFDGSRQDQSRHRISNEPSSTGGSTQVENEQDRKISWRDMARTYASYVNPFGYSPPEGLRANNEGTMT